VDDKYFQDLRKKAEKLYGADEKIRCPYFSDKVTLGADGFHHLRYLPNGRERPHKAQMLKFQLLPLALKAIARSGTIQEYRKIFVAVGKPSKRDKMRKTKEAEYFGLYAIVGDRKQIRIRVILRRVGDGKVRFWSVMPDSDLSNPKLFGDGILGD